MSLILVTQGGTTLAPGTTHDARCPADVRAVLALPEGTTLPDDVTDMTAGELCAYAEQVFKWEPDVVVTILELGPGTPSEGLVQLRQRRDLNEHRWMLPSSWDKQSWLGFVAALADGGAAVKYNHDGSR